MLGLLWISLLGLQTWGMDPTYLIMSMPAAKQIVYAKLPDNILRLLVPATDGIVAPKGICLDNANSRLFITDGPTLRIVWYQLIAQPDGKLITDGRQHVAVNSVSASWCTVDGLGNLYFSGKLIDSLGLPTKECIYKFDALNIVTGTMSSPNIVWSPGNSGTDACVLAPSGLAADLFTVYWGNREEGKKHGTVCKGSTSPPAINPTAIKVATNESASRGMTLTERYLFYATHDGIYGIKKEKSTQGCEHKEDCILITDEVVNPNGVTWDADGTVYFADTGHFSDSGITGAVLSFPSGSLAKHPVEKVVEVQGVHDVAVLTIPPGGHKIDMFMHSSQINVSWLLWLLLLF